MGNNKANNTSVDGAFTDCEQLESVIVGSGVKSLRSGALSWGEFSNCPSLKSVYFEKTPTNCRVLINGKEVAFTAYNIGGNNYFKLRDIASAINGTNKNFSVGWDGHNNAITLNSKTSYNNVGGELALNSNATVTEPQISNPKIFVDGKLTTLMAFNITDNNYIKLRDLGETFDFGVDWNSSTQTIEINTSKGYSK